MKKLILFLLPLFALAQNPTNFPYGIKNTAGATNNTPTYFVTQETDGVHKKTPAANIAMKTDLDLKQTVFTGICQKQYLTENDFTIDNSALTLTISTVKNGTAISAINPVRFFTDGSGIAVMHEKTSPVTFNFTNTTGIWYFYFDSSGNPIATQTPWSEFSTIATVYRFYWNATLGVADRRVIEAVEFHKNDVSWVDHAWKHLDGAKWSSGLTISSNAISAGTPAIDGSNAVITLSSGTILDDNIYYTLTNASIGSVKFTQNLGTGLLPATSGKFICISNSASGLLEKIPATDFPFLWNSGTNTPEYLTVNGTRTAVGNNNYFVYYVYALQDPRYGETIKIKSAETDFANSPGSSAATLAAAHNWEQLQTLFPTLRDGEIRLLYKLTFEYKTSYDVGTKKSVLRYVDDLRKQKTTTTAVASGTVPATNVSVSPVGSIAATNVQSALQELDSETVKLTGDQTIAGIKTIDNGEIRLKSIGTADYFKMYFSDGEFSAKYDLDATAFFAVKNGYLNLYNSAKTFYASFSNTITNNRTYVLPDASGTFALTSDLANGTKTFNYQKDPAASVWIITHNLNNPYPVITVYGSNGEVISPSIIKSLGNNDLSVTFPVAVSGFATLCANSNPFVAPVYDTDAQAFIDAVATLNLVNKTAINQLVLDLKGFSLWGKILMLNPKAGSTASEHKWNLKDPRDLDAAYRETYTGTWVHSVLGAKSNGTNAFANTYLNPNTLSLTGNISMGVYVTEAFTSNGDMYLMGGHSGANNFFAIQKGATNSTTAVAYASGAIARTVPSNAKGFYAISVVSTTKRSHYETSLLEEVATNGTGVCNVPIYEAALNLGGIYGALPFGAGTSFIATGLTNTEMLNLRTAILTYETALGRN